MYSKSIFFYLKNKKESGTQINYYKLPIKIIASLLSNLKYQSKLHKEK